MNVKGLFPIGMTLWLPFVSSYESETAVSPATVSHPPKAER
ncbi:MAG: hypothetical protein AAF490_06410 [Chloroflexota bacterium]